MPELPDVEEARRRAERALRGRRIRDVATRPDPIVYEGVSPRRFARALARRRAPIKSVLLDQGLFAGVGNWIADEVLYQAALRPQRLASDLELAEVRRLRARLLAIVTRAVAVDADSERFPHTWLFHRRWGKDARARTARGERIVHETIGGRTAAWVPARQR